jgi:hypothetical protein
MTSWWKTALIATALISSPAWAQTNPATGVPEAPIGHRQPTAGDVPAGDSVKAPSGASSNADPDQLTPQQRRDDQINKGLCATTTC